MNLKFEKHKHNLREMCRGRNNTDGRKDKEEKKRRIVQRDLEI